MFHPPTPTPILIKRWLYNKFVARNLKRLVIISKWNLFWEANLLPIKVPFDFLKVVVNSQQKLWRRFVVSLEGYVQLAYEYFKD